MSFLLVVASLLPALAIIVFFYRSDRFPEPKNTIAAVAVMGALSIIAILPLAMLLQGLEDLWFFPYGPEFFRAFVLAAFVEESTRFLIVFAVAQTAEFDEPMDGPVYAVAAAMGFAGVENLAYVAEGGAGVALIRALTAVPSHASTAVVMGYLVSLGRFLPHRRREFYALALVLPILIHGFYDVCLMVSEAAGPEASFQAPLQLVWIVGLWIEFDIALRLHRHLAALQFDRALPWWIGRLPFGRASERLDPLFRKLSGVSQLDAADLATLGAAAARRPARESSPPPIPGTEGASGPARSHSFLCSECQARIATVWLKPGELARCTECGAEVAVPDDPA